MTVFSAEALGPRKTRAKTNMEEKRDAENKEDMEEEEEEE